MAEFRDIWQAASGVREMEEYRFSSIIRNRYLLADFNPIWDATKKYEGGYESQDTDPGAFLSGVAGQGVKIGSNKGVSAQTLQRYLGRVPTVDDMKNLTDAQAQDIARQYYWNPIQGDSIKSPGIASSLYDSVWGSGFYGAKMMRQALNQTYGSQVTDPNIKSMAISNSELQLINSAPDQAALFNNFMLLRKKFVQSIPGFATYGKGWLNRLDDIYNKYFSTFTQQTTAFVKKNIVPIMLITFGVIASITLFMAFNAKDNKSTLAPVPAT